MTLRNEYLAIFKNRKYIPAVSELTGDAESVASCIEEYAAGYGSIVVVAWTNILPGNPIFWRRLSGEAAEYGSEKGLVGVDDLPGGYVMVSDLPGKMLPMLVEAAEEVAPCLGLQLTLKVAHRYAGCAVRFNAGIIKQIRNRWILDKYEERGITAWEIAAATQLTLRQVEEILATCFYKESPQLKIWDFQ